MRVTSSAKGIFDVRSALACSAPSRSGGAGGCRALETEALDRHLSHLELLDLAGDRHGELVDDQHVTRHLEVRELAAAVVPDVVLADAFAVAHANPRAQLLAVLVV